MLDRTDSVEVSGFNELLKEYTSVLETYASKEDKKLLEKDMENFEELFGDQVFSAQKLQVDLGDDFTLDMKSIANKASK
ncbi:MAG: hypothetical protein H8E12_14785 [Rhodobacteraceae bacterium]|nr:hypothetical protein [Paracoccaceae bacterium]